jgi:hypothetical protein
MNAQLHTVAQRALADQSAKAAALAATFVLEVPVLISACPRCLGEAAWTQPGTSPDDLIIVEGNHRMLAVALRAMWSMPLPTCIGIFVPV